MTITELRAKAEDIAEDIKNKGVYWKENTFIDYKLELKLSSGVDEVTIISQKFCKRHPCFRK